MRRAFRLAEPAVSRLCRGLSLLVFVALVLGIPVGLVSGVDAPGLDNLFLRLDPLLTLTVPLAARVVVPGLLGGLVMLVLAVRFGRVFCRYLCPMGTTLSLARTCLRPLRPLRPIRLVPPRFRYLVLAATLAAAVVGVNIGFWSAPIPLVTRLYTLVLAPFGLETGLALSGVLAVPGVDVADVVVPVHDGSLFVLLFFGTLLLLEVLSPGCWCNCLCPAGAAQSLAGLGRLRRGVASRSVQASPMQISLAEAVEAPRPVRSALPLPSRRAFVIAVTAGAGLGLVQKWSMPLSAVPGVAPGSSGGLALNVPHDTLWLRPPGALPETAFLALCTRCGLCLHVCPANALQGQGLEGGLAGLFSPVFVPARGGCDPGCTRCGEVCPTGAIAALGTAEKQLAKMGTAVLRPEACLVWEERASCLVCQEVCPFGAIALEPLGGGVFAPSVLTGRCYGCGYCEHHCPASEKAITVTGADALRLEPGEAGGYAKAAHKAGLDLRPGRAPLTLPGQLTQEGPPDEETLPPGFSL